MRSSSIQLIQAGYEPRNYFYDSSPRRCYFTRACRKEEGINNFNEISSVHSTTKRRLTADKNAARWFGGQKSQQVGAFFLKFLRLTPKRGEGKQRKTIIDRVGGGGHTPKVVAVPTCSSQWPSHWQATVAVPSGRASGRPPTRIPPTCLNTLLLLLLLLL